MNHKPRVRIIGRLFVLYRATHLMGIRELAKAIGTSAATLSRIERGHAMDADTLLKVWAWLNSSEGGPTP